MNILEDKTVNLTHFNGCDMALSQENKVIGEIGAITWVKENYLRGKLYFTTPLKSYDGRLHISITVTNEYGECLEIRLKNVTISFPKDYEKEKVVTFEADEVVEIKIE